MQKILIPLFIIFAITLAVFWRPIVKTLGTTVGDHDFRPGSQVTEDQQAPRQSGGTSIFEQLKNGTPSRSEGNPPFSLDTVILGGPREGSTLLNTKGASFSFRAIVDPEDAVSRVRFEIQVEGVDDEWRQISGDTQTITFPAGTGTYTLLARAVADGYADSTPASRTVKVRTSPLLGSVSISAARPSSSTRPLFVRITSGLPEGQSVSLDGWKLVSRNGEFPLPLGVEAYDPPYSSPSQDPIILRGSDQILITNGPNPLMAGLAFRPNSCFGYLSREKQFGLSVPSSCPGYDTPLSSISFLSPSCQDFILNLRECQDPDPSQDLRISTDPECLAYIEDRYTYGACFEEHADDSGFLKNEWHVYAEKDFLRQGHDVLRLIDASGLLVDEHIY